MQLTLYIDTSSNRLLSSLNTSSSVQPSSLPFFVGDTLQLQIYLMKPLQTFTPSVPGYQIIPTLGITLELFITNGLDSSSPDYQQYTQQIDWATDPNNQYFYAGLSLNTPDLVALIGNSTSAKAYLVIGNVVPLNDTTYLYQPITLQPGVPTTNLVVPPGLTPLSLEAAVGLFVPQSGVPANAPLAFGGGFILTSPTGLKLFCYAKDDGQGGVTLQSDQIP